MHCRFRGGPFSNGEMTVPFWRFFWFDVVQMHLRGPLAAALYPEAYDRPTHYWKPPFSRTYRFRH